VISPEIYKLNSLTKGGECIIMRIFCASKAAELEAELVENGILFEHPNEDLQQFLVSDDDADTIDAIARKMGINVYLKDDYVTEEDILGNRESELD
jgi:hypothetical protein